MAVSGRLCALFLGVMAAFSGSIQAEVLDLSQTNLNDLQSQIPDQIANTNITDKGRKLLSDKCIGVAGAENGPKAYEAIEQGTNALVECVQNIVNISALQIEIEDASPLGELDVVFNKYCLRVDDMYACFDNFNKKLVPCLDKEEQENQIVLMRIVKSLLGFICHKGGDQIALFIAEQGPECISSKREDIEQCVNNTFSGYIPTNGFDDVKTLPKFVMGKKQCKDMETLENCIVHTLETCKEITPANIVESMFRFIKNETICRTNLDSMAAKQKAGKNNASHTNPIGLSTMIYGILFAIYMLVAKYLRA